jgi:hypothetical protein
MSYDIDLKDPVTGKTIELDEPHHMKGGTYCVGGTTQASLNVTYNYAKHYYRVLGEKGIRTIYGMTGAESIPVLDAAIVQLDDDVVDDYWKPTEGNAKRALLQLRALACMRPDGVWDMDPIDDLAIHALANVAGNMPASQPPAVGDLEQQAMRHERAAAIFASGYDYGPDADVRNMHAAAAARLRAMAQQKAPAGGPGRSTTEE